MDWADFLCEKSTYNGQIVNISLKINQNSKPWLRATINS
jgi:hypothetical protein